MCFGPCAATDRCSLNYSGCPYTWWLTFEENFQKVTEAFKMSPALAVSVLISAAARPFFILAYNPL